MIKISKNLKFNQMNFWTRFGTREETSFSIAPKIMKFSQTLCFELNHHHTQNSNSNKMFRPLWHFHKHLARIKVALNQI